MPNAPVVLLLQSPQSPAAQGTGLAALLEDRQHQLGFYKVWVQV